MTFLAYFYTDVCGIEAAAMGTMFLVVRGVTALVDPLFGMLSDRTVTRWGKFRPYLVWFCLPFALVTIAAFTAPDLSPSGKLAYAFVTQTLLMACYSAINVPYSALGAVLTSDTHQRVSINGYRFFLATAGGAVVASSTMPLVRLLGGGDERVGFPLTASVLSVLAVGMLIACFYGTRERVKQASPERGDLLGDLAELFRNDQWRVIAAMNFALFVAIIIQDGSAVYYITWCVGRPDLLGPFVTTGLVASMLGAAAAGPAVGRLSKARAYRMLQLLIVLLSLVLWATPTHAVAWIFFVYAVQQFFTQMASPILWSMMADVVDYGEATSGRRITGLAMSGALLALKFGAAVGGALLGWSLSYCGYESLRPTQTDEAVMGILYLFTLVPAAGHLVLMLLTCWVRQDEL